MFSEKFEESLPASQDEEIKMKTLMHRYNAIFRQILPRRKNSATQNNGAPYLDKQLCLEVIQQFDLTLQLLVQQIIFCDDPVLKEQACLTFDEIVRKKVQFVKKMNLPSFEIFLADFVSTQSLFFHESSLLESFL